MAPGPLGEAWMTRNSTCPFSGDGRLSGIDRMTAFWPVATNPVATTVVSAAKPFKSMLVLLMPTAGRACQKPFRSCHYPKARWYSPVARLNAEQCYVGKFLDSVVISTSMAAPSWIAWTKRTRALLEPQLEAKMLKAARANARGRAFNQRDILNSPKGSLVASRRILAAR